MNRFFAASAAFAFLSTVIVAAAGCSVGGDDQTGEAEGAATPPNPSGNYALADTCSRLFKRHEVVHDLDLEKGTIRWGCGDVPGVTDPDLGQEYCEYKAVQNGKIAAKPSDIVSGGGKVSCVFTGVFRDVPSTTTQKLQAAMADAANLGAAAANSNIVTMNGGFNSRGAATQLMSDCSASPGAATLVVRQRTAACFLAVQAGGPNAAQLGTLCKGNLSDGNIWSQVVGLGVSVKASGQDGFEPQQDIASCMQVINAGVPWRNSDPMICSRSERSANECGCKWNPVPNALEGFPFTGWVDDHIPSTCRLAKVAGQDYNSIVICDVPDAQLSDLALNPAYNRSLQNFCHDAFGKDLVLKLPLRSLAQTGTCNTTSPFCSEYLGGTSPTVGTPDGTTDTTGTTTTTGTTRSTGAPPPPVDPNGSTH